MAKFDPDGFDAMMARIAAEQEEAEVLEYEALEPDYDYLAAGKPPIASASKWGRIGK